MNLMPRDTLRDILHDGEIPPATPLPSICAGPEALRHCLTTVLPNKFLCWVPKPAPWHSLQVPTFAMLRRKLCRVKIPAAYM